MEHAPAAQAQDRWREALARLTREFEAELAERLARAGALLDAHEAAPDDPAPLDELQRLMHVLAGSAGTFGQADLGTAAKALELHLIDSRPAADPAALARSRDLLAQVRRAARQP